MTLYRQDGGAEHLGREARPETRWQCLWVCSCSRQRKMSLLSLAGPWSASRIRPAHQACSREPPLLDAARGAESTMAVPSEQVGQTEVKFFLKKKIKKLQSTSLCKYLHYHFCINPLKQMSHYNWLTTYFKIHIKITLILSVV